MTTFKVVFEDSLNEDSYTVEGDKVYAEGCDYYIESQGEVVVVEAKRNIKCIVPVKENK